VVLLIDASNRMSTSVQSEPDGPSTSGLDTAMHCAVMLYRNKYVAQLWLAYTHSAVPTPPGVVVEATRTHRTPPFQDHQQPQ
jgi:hypothetical protein